MSPPRHAEIFESVVGLSPADRNTWLAEACGDGTTLRERVQSLLDAHDHESDASAWADERAQRRRLHDCLGRLEPRQRQSVVMAFLEGLSHTEVAARMDRPLGSVKGWIRRAMGHLKDCLEHA